MESANKMRFQLTICGFNLQFADSDYNLQISITVADSASAQFNDTSVPSFVRGFHKLSIFRKIAYFWRNFERYNVLGIFFARIQNSNEVQRKVAMLRIP